MTSQELWRLPWPRRGILTLASQLGTVAGSIVKRRDPGFSGLLTAAGLILKYSCLVLFVELVLGSKARLLASAYAWARTIDDRFDGFSTFERRIGIQSYLSQKQDLVLNASSLGKLALPTFEEDILLIHVLKAARRLGIDLSGDMRRLWDIFCYDVARIHDFALIPERELLRHATEQDVAILAPCVKVLGGDAVSAEAVFARLGGIFTRIDCFSDLLVDFRQGVVNIPQEAVASCRINLASLRHCRTWGEAARIPGFSRWHREEAARLSGEWGSAKPQIVSFAETLFKERLASRLKIRVSRRIFRGLLKLFEASLREARERLE